MTEDQWILEYVRSRPEVQAAVGNNVFMYEIPSAVQQPYLLIQLISGGREPKTQSFRYAGTTRFQLDLYGSNRYTARTDLETIIGTLSVSNLLQAGLRIEGIKLSGPRMLPCEEGFRFSFDLSITWVQED